MNPKTIFIYSLQLVLALSFVACTDRTPELHEETEIADNVIQREHEEKDVIYRNPHLGFAISGTIDADIFESVERMAGKQMVLVDVRRQDQRVALRAVPQDWPDVLPLVRLDQRARDLQQEMHLNGVSGYRTHLQRLNEDYVRLEGNNIIYEILGTPEMVDELLPAILWMPPAEEDLHVIALQRLSLTDLPVPVAERVNNLLRLDMMPMVHSFSHEGKAYVFATWGKREQEGYSVRFQNATLRNNVVYVQVQFDSSVPDASPQPLRSSPYDIAMMDAAGMPVEFDIVGDRTPAVVATIKGIETIPTIHAESRSIKIFSPPPDSEVGGTLTISGVANVHEANVEYRVLNRDGNLVHSGFTTAYAAMAWGYFQFDISVSEFIEPGEPFTIELFFTDMDTGERRDIVELSLSMK